MALKRGAAKSKKTSPKKADAMAPRDEEWVPSQTGEAELNRLVEADVLLTPFFARVKMIRVG